MTTTYTYPDAYLAKFCTEAREARAIEDVAVMAGSNTFSADWLERLTITQTYILACQEQGAAPDDLFAAKLKIYRAQLGVQLPQAIANAKATAGTVSGIGMFSIPIFRG
jgi:hypothetical protein